MDSNGSRLRDDEAADRPGGTCAGVASRGFGDRGSERGAALIALVVVLALGSGIVTIGWMEATARSAHVSLRTEAALAAARDALVGYAASYPDQHAGRHGPGYLPCPDTSGNGSPNTPCRRDALGRLPWRRLGLHDPRDGAGERLWYAIDRRFRAIGYKHRPLNGATPADLEVDGRAGVAAVIMAAGPPLSFQQRGRDRFAAAQYLEGGNERSGDLVYASRPPSHDAPGRPQDRFNDRVAAISRDELMAAAGRRVLAAVRRALETFRNAPWNPGVMPWLAPWDAADPDAVALPIPGVIAGRLPVAAPGSRFATSFAVVGFPAGGSRAVTGTVDAAALLLAGSTVLVPSGECEWTGVERIDCAGESGAVPSSGREYVFRFELHFAGDPEIVAPASTEIRRRAVSGVEWSAESRIEIVELAGGTETGRVTFRFAPGPIRGSLRVTGVAYPLGGGDEVPAWLLENQWHRSLLLAVAPAFSPAGEGACGVSGRCLELVRTTFEARSTESEAIAVAILAGAELEHQHRESPGLLQWFEGENANPANLRFERRYSDQSFNDRVAVVEPAREGVTP